MSRLSILSVLVVGLPLIGCAQAPTQSAAVADNRATPVGSHIAGAAADPTALNVSRGDLDQARPYGVQQGLNNSSLFPFATISGR